MPNIYLKYDNRIYRFINFTLSQTDGSLYISLLREGMSVAHIFSSYDPTRNFFDNVHVLSTDRRKTKRISYHPTGLINYHDIKASRVLGEPLGAISQPFHFLTYSIPALQKLDLYTGSISEEDSVFEISSDNGERVSFSFAVAPWNYSFEAESPYLSVSYYKLMSINIFIQFGAFVPADMIDHFIYLTPPKGLLEDKLLDKDQALITFHQLINETKELILYSSNGEGYYKLVFAVPMRIPPRVEIELEDESLSVIEDKKTKSSVRFKIVDNNNKTIKTSVGIKAISLDAEIY